MRVELYYKEVKLVKKGIVKIEERKLGNLDIIALYFPDSSYFPAYKNNLKRMVVVCE